MKNKNGQIKASPFKHSVILPNIHNHSMIRSNIGKPPQS